MARRGDEDGDETRAVPVVDLLGEDGNHGGPGGGGAGSGRRGRRPLPARDRANARDPATAPQDPAQNPAQNPARGEGTPHEPAAAPPARMPLRYRVLPRSLLGITALILAFAIGAGLSGVVLYSYYQYKLNQTDDRVNTLVNGYKQQFARAEGDLAAQTANDKAQIDSQLGPLQSLVASPGTLAKLTRQLAPSVFFVHTLDANGQASVGSAFVISSNQTQSLLLTSYTTIAAATRAPAPAVYVQQGQTSTQVTVRSWDPSYDLALIVLPRGGVPALPVAPASPAPQVGQRVYAVSGEGAAGASLAQGIVTDVSASSLQHDAPLGPAYQGGPLVDDAGHVVAIASRTYAPLGFSTDAVWFAPYVQAACNKVLSCPGGTLPTS